MPLTMNVMRMPRSVMTNVRHRACVARTTPPSCRLHAPPTHLPTSSHMARARLVKAQATANQSPDASEHHGSMGDFVRTISIGAGIAAALGAAWMVTTGTPLSVVREVLAHSGLTASFSLIFVSEIGDKTFFIAALLAMRFGRMISLIGTMAALTLMTIISVGIGYVFKNVPEALRTSAPIGEYLSVALLFWFGATTLWEALRRPALASASDLEGSSDDEELREAETEVNKLGDLARSNRLAVLAEVASLIFVAEWGDRSMLATVALGAAQNPLGVALGAVAGHFAATLIAVAGGAYISRYISERAIAITGGVLFIVFGAATLIGLM